MKLNQKEPVYIIIPVHNRKNITLKCLETLKQCGDLNRYYIVVVDDGSTDGTSEAITNLYPEVTTLTGDGNLWWTGAIKKGMEYAYQQGAEYFIWLNDDCIVSDKVLEDLVSLCKTNNYQIIGCQGQELNNSEIIAFGGKVRHYQGYKFLSISKGEVKPCDMLSGNLVCLPREIVHQIGYPNPNILRHYGGDALYLIKARKAGFSIYVDHRNQVFNNNLTGESNLSPQRWLLKPGKPLDIFYLMFISKSILHWKVWFHLYINDYYKKGFILFLFVYTTKIIIPVIIISILRYLPLSWRIYLSKTKNSILNIA